MAEVMKTDDVPERLVELGWSACKTHGIPWHPDAVRILLAAVLPTALADRDAEATNPDGQATVTIHGCSEYKDEARGESQ